MLYWVESKTFVGQCRRALRSGIRLVERRREDSAAPLPSLPTLLRQLTLFDFRADSSDDALGRFRVRLDAALALAEAQQEPACVAELRELIVLVEHAPEADSFQDDILAGLQRATEALR